MKVLITGKNSYVGRAAALRLTEAGHEVEELDMIGKAWKEKDFRASTAFFTLRASLMTSRANRTRGCIWRSTATLPSKLPKSQKQRRKTVYFHVEYVAV